MERRTTCIVVILPLVSIMLVDVKAPNHSPISLLLIISDSFQSTSCKPISSIRLVCIIIGLFSDAVLRLSVLCLHAPPALKVLELCTTRAMHADRSVHAHRRAWHLSLPAASFIGFTLMYSSKEKRFSAFKASQNHQNLIESHRITLFRTELSRCHSHHQPFEIHLPESRTIS